MAKGLRDPLGRAATLGTMSFDPIAFEKERIAANQVQAKKETDLVKKMRDDQSKVFDPNIEVFYEDQVALQDGFVNGFNYMTSTLGKEPKDITERDLAGLTKSGAFLNSLKQLSKSQEKLFTAASDEYKKDSKGELYDFEQGAPKLDSYIHPSKYATEEQIKKADEQIDAYVTWEMGEGEKNAYRDILLRQDMTKSGANSLLVPKTKMPDYDAFAKSIISKPKTSGYETEEGVKTTNVALDEEATKEEIKFKLATDEGQKLYNYGLENNLWADEKGFVDKVYQTKKLEAAEQFKLDRESRGGGITFDFNNSSGVGSKGDYSFVTTPSKVAYPSSKGEINVANVRLSSKKANENPNIDVTTGDKYYNLSSKSWETVGSETGLSKQYIVPTDLQYLKIKDENGSFTDGQWYVVGSGLNNDDETTQFAIKLSSAKNDIKAKFGNLTEEELNIILKDAMDKYRSSLKPSQKPKPNSGSKTPKTKLPQLTPNSPL